MPNGDTIQIHMLTAYPATLLNRDDAGLAKRVPFGGETRTRVSSQCLKKHWREAPEVIALGPQAVRSTRIYEERVARPLKEEHGATEEEAVAIASYLMDNTVDTNVEEKDGMVVSGQLLVLTRAETDFLADVGVEILEAVREAGADAIDAKTLKEIFPLTGRKSEYKGMLKELSASLDTALFGRMVTSDLFSRVDASVSVAHAFTTHGEAAEIDYFTAVDTLKTSDDDAGAGLIQETELTTGVFYIYAVIDMKQLEDNLGAATDLAEPLSRNLIRAMATVSPGAKRGSTAPFSYAEFVLLERGDAQPRTLANAFLHPVEANGADLMARSVEELAAHRDALSNMYGADRLISSISTIHAVDVPDNMPLDEALDKILPESAEE